MLQQGGHRWSLEWTSGFVTERIGWACAMCWADKIISLALANRSWFAWVEFIFDSNVFNCTHLNEQEHFQGVIIYPPGSMGKVQSCSGSPEVGQEWTRGLVSEQTRCGGAITAPKLDLQLESAWLGSQTWLKEIESA